MQMKFPRRLLRPGALALGAAAFACAAAAFAAMHAPPESAAANAISRFMDVCTSGDPALAGFAAENDAAMARMMAGMSIKPSGSVDRDFAEMMIAHHQGAIDMAQAELRHGANEQLRRIAQEIIVEQQQEIAAMRLALGQPLPPSVPAPTQTGRL
ncbi:DUF305 domain-containing protein [Variovorax sp. OK202]|uniref:DUF305 domain-containing protein n=1 Tax=unclassified Variovorax TaxID=663243 RepID=UPI0008ACFCB6|nr:protein of unknown function [Variovorax sp. OK202]SFE68784.1 protein of unknown function [Variovorax sp. OK212]